MTSPTPAAPLAFGTVTVLAASVLVGIVWQRRGGHQRGRQHASEPSTSTEHAPEQPKHDVQMTFPMPAQPASADGNPPARSGGPLPAAGGAAILARLRAERAAHAAAAAAAKAEAAAQRTVTFLYASQTGTAEEIARSLHDDAIQRGLKSTVSSMNEWTATKINANETPVVVVIASSTGDGDTPDNASRCVLQLKKSLSSGALKGVLFTVMGLGDSNYTKFMHVPRTIRRRMLELGGTEFMDSGEADEVDGLEDIVDAWRDKLWEPLKEAVQPETNENASAAANDGQAASELPDDFTMKGNLVEAGANIQGVPALRPSRLSIVLQTRDSSQDGAGPSDSAMAYRDPEGRYSLDKPFWATLRSCKLQTSSECPKRVYQVVLDVTDSGMKFAPGDAMALCPCNDPALVDQLLNCLQWDGTLVLTEASPLNVADTAPAARHLRVGYTLHYNLSWALDITSPPSKALLVTLAAHASDAKEASTLRFLSSRDGRGAYKLDIAEGRPNLLQLLKRYPSCRPPVSVLLQALPAMRPRPYSLANCNTSEEPQTLEAAFHVVNYETHWGAHAGVATHWLERMAAAVGEANGASSACRIPVHLQKSTGFRPPDDASTPIIMIGPGTGVAPFRGFLQHRRAQAASGATLGESWLFFGNWRPDWDFLFEDDFRGFVKDGTLSHLTLAWSRQSETKVYVQDKMKAAGAELAEALLERDASVYICGDGAKMAKDVHAALLEIVQTHGDMDGIEASEFFKDLASQHKYLKDVWS